MCVLQTVWAGLEGWVVQVPSAAGCAGVLEEGLAKAPTDLREGKASAFKYVVEV